MEGKIKNKLTESSKALIIANIIVATLWTYFCFKTASPLVLTWIGFLGWTSYYVNQKNIAKSVISNITGVIIGCIIVYLGYKFFDNLSFINALITGLFTGLIIYLGVFEDLFLTASIFLGGASAFALGGGFAGLLISFILGNLLGPITEFIKVLIENLFKSNKRKNKFNKIKEDKKGKNKEEQNKNNSEMQNKIKLPKKARK